MFFRWDSLLQLGVSATIIALVATKLNNVDFIRSNNGNMFDVQISNACLMGYTENQQNLCTYAYAVAGVSVLATVVLGILQVCNQAAYVTAYLLTPC